MIVFNLKNMFISPIQNVSGSLPRITQFFGVNPKMYAKYDMKGHPGIDYGVVEGTPVFAPIDGWIKIGDEGKEGYGKHVKIRSFNRECVLGHFSEFLVKDGVFIHFGDKIALSGNTGYSFGAHTHFGVRRLIENQKQSDIWKLQIQNYNNGFKGYIDILPWIICWEGTFVQPNL